MITVDIKFRPACTLYNALGHQSHSQIFLFSKYNTLPYTESYIFTRFVVGLGLGLGQGAQ